MNNLFLSVHLHTMRNPYPQFFKSCHHYCNLNESLCDAIIFNKITNALFISTIDKIMSQRSIYSSYSDAHFSSRSDTLTFGLLTGKIRKGIKSNPYESYSVYSFNNIS